MGGQARWVSAIPERAWASHRGRWRTFFIRFWAFSSGSGSFHLLGLFWEGYERVKHVCEGIILSKHALIAIKITFHPYFYELLNFLFVKEYMHNQDPYQELSITVGLYVSMTFFTTMYGRTVGTIFSQNLSLTCKIYFI